MELSCCTSTSRSREFYSKNKIILKKPEKFIYNNTKKIYKPRQLKNINFILNVLTKLNPVDVKNKDYEFGLKDMAYKINLRPVQAVQARR